MARDQRRLFLALWPGEADRRQLAALAAKIGGQRRVCDADLHLTLVFLGATDATRLATYEAALADLAIPTLELTLDRYGYWPQSRIVWLGSSAPLPALEDWVAALHQRLRNCGFTPERRAFQAHITLARKHPGPAPTQTASTPMYWKINEISLVESLRSRDARYQVLRRWPGARLADRSME